MEPEVTRKAEGRSRKAARSEEIALALMGVAPLPADLIAADATWEHGQNGTALGRDAIVTAFKALKAPERITVDQVVAHGRAATISGRLTRAGQNKIFCHIIRHTTPAATQIAQIVSFEHQDGSR